HHLGRRVGLPLVADEPAEYSTDTSQEQRCGGQLDGCSHAGITEGQRPDQAPCDDTEDSATHCERRTLLDRHPIPNRIVPEQHGGPRPAGGADEAKYHGAVEEVFRHCLSGSLSSTAPGGRQPAPVPNWSRTPRLADTEPLG